MAAHTKNVVTGPSWGMTTMRAHPPFQGVFPCPARSCGGGWGASRGLPSLPALPSAFDLAEHAGNVMRGEEANLQIQLHTAVRRLAEAVLAEEYEGRQKDGLQRDYHRQE